MRANAGRVLMVGLSGPDLQDGEKRSIENLRPGGIILFRRNLDTRERLARLMADLDAVLPDSPWVAIDQEGGRVSRLEPWIGPTCSAFEKASQGPDAALQFGLETGTELYGLGFNLDFAPVVDLCPPEKPNGIGDRSWGTDPGRVAELTGRFLAGLHEAGVAGCLKHFPGLGDTAVDSHVELPVCERSEQDLIGMDLLPYRKLGPDSPAVMVCHAWFPALEPQDNLPATLSRRIITGLLRNRVGYGGMVCADDLEMGAVAPLDVGGSAAVASIRAGADLLPYCSDLARAEAARDALLREAERDGEFAVRLEQAAGTVRSTAAKWPRR